MRIFDKRSNSYRRAIIIMLICLIAVVFLFSLKTMGNINDEIFWDGVYMCIVFFIVSAANFLHICKKHSLKKQSLDNKNKKHSDFIRDIFDIDKYPESYLGPVIKILVGIGILVILQLLRQQMEDTVDFFLGIVSGICFFYVLITFVQLLIVKENRGKAKKISEKKYKKSKKFPIEEIIEMVEKYDIMEYEIVFEGKVIGIGSMSDSEPGRSDFFDKCFYVGKEEFTEIGDFIKAVQPYVDENGEVLVITVNEGPPR